MKKQSHIQCVCPATHTLWRTGVDFQELIPSMDGRNPSPRGCARLHQPVRSVMQLGRTKCFSTVTNVAAATVPLYLLSLLQPP